MASATATADRTGLWRVGFEYAPAAPDAMAVHDISITSSRDSSEGAGSRRQDFCHFADTPSPSLLKHLLEGEGTQQNESLATG